MQIFRDVRLLQKSLGPLPQPVRKPFLIVLSGLPGTGKSYFSRELARRMPLVILESDALRKVLFPSPKYTWQESARLFETCYRLIDWLLKERISLILDSTNLYERHRRQLKRIAKENQAGFILVKLEAPSEVARERLAARMRDPSNRSDADWAVYQSMKLRAEKIRQKHYIVDTTGDIDTIIDKIVREAMN